MNGRARYVLINSLISFDGFEVANSGVDGFVHA
jgi:hypothetical protein